MIPMELMGCHWSIPDGYVNRHRAISMKPSLLPDCEVCLSTKCESRLRWVIRMKVTCQNSKQNNQDSMMLNGLPWFTSRITVIHSRYGSCMFCCCVLFCFNNNTKTEVATLTDTLNKLVSGYDFPLNVKSNCAKLTAFVWSISQVWFKSLYIASFPAFYCWYW